MSSSFLPNPLGGGYPPIPQRQVLVKKNCKVLAISNALNCLYAPGFLFQKYHGLSEIVREYPERFGLDSGRTAASYVGGGGIATIFSVMRHGLLLAW